MAKKKIPKCWRYNVVEIINRLCLLSFGVHLCCWFFSKVSPHNSSKHEFYCSSFWTQSMDFCLRAAFILKGISTVLFFFSTSWKNRIWCLLFISMFSSSSSGPLWDCLLSEWIFHDSGFSSVASTRRSQNAWINEREQQERQRVNPYQSWFPLKSQTDRLHIRLSRI